MIGPRGAGQNRKLLVDTAVAQADFARMTLTLTILMLAAQSGGTIPVVVEMPKLVCRESEQDTGTHIRAGRKCKTAEEWDRDDAEKRAKATTMRVTEGQGDALTKQRPQ